MLPPPFSLGGCSKSEAESSAAGSQTSSEENKTLTEKMMDNMKAGEYSIDITVSGLESSGDTDCKITAHDGKTFTSLNYGGIYTEFYSIDDISTRSRTKASLLPMGSSR